MPYRLLLFLLLGLAACSKADSDPIVDFGEGEGISYRTSNNFPVGPQDPTDWTLDGDWNKQERALFSDLGLDLNGTRQSAPVFYTSAYPNPSASGQATWSIQPYYPTSGSVATYTVRAVLVSRKYEVMLQIGPRNFVSGAAYSFDYLHAGFSPNELYRLYYVVYNPSGLLYKGHGDVRYSE